MFSLVIQAGGKSSRMGRDKALLPFGGQTLIERVIARLAPLADEILVTTNRPADYEFLGLPLFADILPERGALGGLYTALKSARSPLVAIVACDMPFASPQIFTRLTALAAAADVAIPRSAAGLEPLHAVYRRESCLPAVEQSLQDNEWKVIAWFARVRVATLESGELARLDPSGQAFLNLNTPEEWEKFSRR
ncbi:MAG: molybdenum cofactor guanylyltransferase [Anaerolineales bacterium]